ncbi:MAG: restriction endonuclease subunit S [Sulfuricaulis sp.]|uniref:restriction endonuclease subunit S n=1 Tax=Sulfuricaulis sp. TaxID=2003553 RepID=UPI0025FA149E|nr:restriction endonuclease subunit S [Sulfuricaulis sp.]MCR4345974.1 restriction endonuclease subunit S [Sulfuricaulis sp.]
MTYSLELFVSVLEKNIDNRGKTPPLSAIGYPLIEVKHIQEDRLYPVFDDTKYVDQETWDTWFRAHLEPGDILFSTVGSIARSCMVPATPKFCIAQNVLGFRVNRSKADPRFLYYAINDSFFQHEVHGRTIETVQKSIKVHDLKTCRIPLPPLSEQKAIASILGSLDDKIELNRRMNATLEAMARALFQSWFVDFDPVRAKLDGRPPTGLDPETAALFPATFQDSPLGHVPQGWGVKSLGEVIELAYGKPLKAENRKNGPICVYGANGPVGWHDEKLVSGPGIVVGRKGNPGVITWAHCDFFPIDTTFYVVPIGDCRSLYFLYYALSNHGLSNLSADSAVPGLNRNHAYMSKQIIPTRQVFDAFDMQISPIFAAIHAYEQQSRTLATLRDTLLPKLLSGEVSVSSTQG